MITLTLRKADHPYWFKLAEENRKKGPAPVDDAFQLTVLRDPVTEQQFMPQQDARRLIGFGYNVKLTGSAIT